MLLGRRARRCIVGAQADRTAATATSSSLRRCSHNVAVVHPRRQRDARQADLFHGRVIGSRLPGGNYSANRIPAPTFVARDTASHRLIFMREDSKLCQMDTVGLMLRDSG
jgi:hypothetical protein